MSEEKILIFSNGENSIDILGEDSDSIIVSLDLLHQDNTNQDHNDNMCNISRETIEKAIPTFKNKPIIYRLNRDGTNLDDHAHNEHEDRSVRIGGGIPADSRFKFIERENGKTYLNCEGVLHKAYCPQLLEILQKNDGKLKVSIEIKAKGKQDEKSGIFVINEFILRGCLILPPEIREGIENSNIEVLKFSDKDKVNFNNAYLQFSAKNIDIFEKIKNSTKDNKIDNIKNIKINKSKEAMSNTPWGDIDKTELRNKIINEPNANALVDFIYMKVEKDWDTAPSEKLGYPIGEIKDGEAVYNRGGLSSALGYAKAENDDKVVSKIETIYKKLELKEEDNMEEKDKKVDNKLDKDNKDIAKIKDDADALEDKTKEDVKKNAVDKKEGDKLKDDVDSDKDYWKKKFSELEAECNACKNELKTYKKKEEKEEMKNSLKSYRKCFSTKEELEEFSKNIETDSKEEFECKLTNKMKEFVKKMSDEEEEDDDDNIQKVEKEFKNSFKASPEIFNLKPLKEGKRTIEDLANL